MFVIPDNAPHSDTPLRGRKYQDVLEAEELDPVAASIPSRTGRVTARSWRR